jgi:hypothetical protein
MNKTVLAIVSLTYFLSCNTKTNKLGNCAYNFNTFQKNFNNSRYDKRITDENWIEVMDKDNDFGEKGLYQYDENLRLRRYAFLLDSTNEAYYIVQYDSLGNEIERPKSEVVRWYIRSESKDSLRLAFYLNAIQHQYKNIQIQYSDTTVSITKLEDSERFTNLIGARFLLPKLQKGAKVVLTGLKINTCTNIQQKFNDFVIIPSQM